jgi:nucleoside-diphosphate-sugar epimerase
VAEGPPPREPAYNLAQPDIVSLRELVEQIAGILGVAPTFVDASWNELAAAGLPADFLPYAGRWASVLDPSRATADWGFTATRLEDYLPGVVRAHLERRPAASHPGYAHREQERAFAETLRQGSRGGR